MATCFVSGCKSGRKTKENEGTKCHFFHPPKNDPELFKKWEEACFRKDKRLSMNNRVCQKHFAEDMLVTEVEIPMNDGTIVVSMLDRWRLKPGSIPTQYVTKPPEPLWSSPKLRSILAPKKRFQAKVADGMSGHEGIDAPPRTVSVDTQTPLTGLDLSAEQQRWKQRYFNLKKMILKAKAKKRSGVFLSFHKLSSRERTYARALSRKSGLRKVRGTRIPVASKLSSQGRKTLSG